MAIISLLQKWKLELALEQLRAGRISIGKAAEQSGSSLWEMLEIVKANQADWTDYSNEEMEKDLALLSKIQESL